MFRHLKVNSLAQMNNEIMKFITDLLGISNSTDPIKILSKNGLNVMWFKKDPSRGGVSAWIGDAEELDTSPWESDSTVGAAGKYKLDMWRLEIDQGETATAKSDLNRQNSLGRAILDLGAKTATDNRDAYVYWYINSLKIRNEIEVYTTNDHCYRQTTTNVFHLGGLLKYDEVPDYYGKGKFLDCNYTDGTFMFNLYSYGIPQVTRSLVVGELDTYREISGRSYIFCNSWIAKSYEKQGRYEDSFFLEDIVGRNRIPLQQRAIALGSGEYMQSYYDNYQDKRQDTLQKKQEFEEAEKTLEDATKEAYKYRTRADKARHKAETAREAADQEPDPDAKAEKETWAETLEQEAGELEELAQEKEQEKDEAEVDYYDKKHAYEAAIEAEEASYQTGRAAYIDIFTPIVQAVESKEGNENHYTANCPADEQIITYNNEVFCAYRLDVDADHEGDKEYSVNGSRVAFHLHTAPKDLHLKYYDTSARYYPPKTMTSPVLYGWEHQVLHYTYESYESNVGVNHYPLLDTVKKTYEIWDELAHTYKPFQCFSRSGTGGKSVNNINNNSEVFPMIFYVERDDEQLDSWSATGQTEIVNYVNMYNMGTGTFLHPQSHDAEFDYTCYDVWRRRMEITPWNPVINDEDNEWKEVWGLGGYPGIAFRTTLENDLTELRERVVL